MEKKIRIAVIGAGVAGLSIARLMRERCDVTVYERAATPGGLIRCCQVQGHLFHLTGGHVFNTHRRDVLDWFWTLMHRDSEFTLADRNSAIIMPDGRHVNYPLENHAYQLAPAHMQAFTADLVEMARRQGSAPRSFGEFLRLTFGPTLYHLYFEPYNEKVWRTSLEDVPLSWLDGKLPMPTVQEILYANFSREEERKFVHSTFWYPRTGGSQFIADRLAEGSDIRYGCDIDNLTFANGKWTVAGEVYDSVVYCGNLKELPAIVRGLDLAAFTADIASLKAHGTTTVLCEIDENPYSWIYLPDRSHQAHRIICTGNFSPSNRGDGRMSATVEFTDETSYADILDNLQRIPMHPRYLTHNYAPYTYPIQSEGTRHLVAEISRVTSAANLHLLGRFAQWEYYNMDAAMGAALDLEAMLVKNI